MLTPFGRDGNMRGVPTAHGAEMLCIPITAVVDRRYDGRAFR
jgi:hypothetical protein